jgi:hypothetical protein
VLNRGAAYDARGIRAIRNSRWQRVKTGEKPSRSGERKSKPQMNADEVKATDEHGLNESGRQESRKREKLCLLFLLSCFPAFLIHPFSLSSSSVFNPCSSVASLIRVSSASICGLFFSSVAVVARCKNSCAHTGNAETFLRH